MEATTPISFLTAGELEQLIGQVLDNRMAALQRQITGAEQEDNEETVYGLEGIAKHFHVSIRTAQRYKATWLKPAITQVGNLIMCNTRSADICKREESRKCHNYYKPRKQRNS